MSCSKSIKEFFLSFNDVKEIFWYVIWKTVSIKSQGSCKLQDSFHEIEYYLRLNFNIKYTYFSLLIFVFDSTGGNIYGILQRSLLNLEEYSICCPVLSFIKTSNFLIGSAQQQVIISRKLSVVSSPVVTCHDIATTIIFESWGVVKVSSASKPLTFYFYLLWYIEQWWHFVCRCNLRWKR